MITPVGTEERNTLLQRSALHAERIPSVTSQSESMVLKNKPEIPEPDYDDPKEVYAFFGLAAYAAQVLERGVIFLALELHLNDSDTFTEDVLDSLLAGLEEKTLGQLIRGIREMGFPSAELENQLGETLRLRNELTHRFFWDHAEDLMTDSGRREMIDRLRSMIGKFQDADVQTSRTMFKVSRRTGFTEEAVQILFDEMKARLEGQSDT